MLGIRSSMDSKRKKIKPSRYDDPKEAYKLDDRIIKSCSQHIEEAVTGSTWFYFAKNDFY